MVATTCRGHDLANDAVARHGRLSHLEIGATLRLGGFFAFPLPEKGPDAIRRTQALFELAMDHDPRELDVPPIVSTAFGDLPVVRDERCALLEELARRPHDERAVKLRRAAVALDDRFDGIHEAWDTRRREVWAALREAELLAAERFYRYLMANLVIVQSERERYLGGADHTAEELCEAAKRVHEARGTWQVNELKRAAVVVDGVAALLTVLAVVGSVERGDVTVDARARAQMAAAAGLQDEAQRQLMEGVAEYLTVLRKEAARFPVLLVLDHDDVLNRPQDARRAALTALDDAENAIGDLCRVGVGASTVPAYRVADLSRMAERIAEGGRVCVWKLPFFVDQALHEMPPRDANVVRRMRRFAAEVERGDAIAHGIALGAVDTAMLAAPLAGPVGVGVAFLWAVVTLARTVHEYDQLTDLFEASIDPAVLLPDGEHGPASAMGIFFDLLGLLV